MSVVGLRLKKDMEGTPTLNLDKTKAKKNITTTRSFERSYNAFKEVSERVSTFAASCSEKLRSQHSNCNAIMVFLATNGFREDLPQYSRSIKIKLPFPSNSAIELSKFATTALRLIFRQGYLYKKAGVIVMDITPESDVQLNLFKNSDPRHKHLMRTIDKINQTTARKVMKLASQDQKRTWKMKQEKLSPRYTTRLDEIIEIS